MRARFTKENKHLGYTTKEDFLQDAARWRLEFLSDKYEFIKMRKDVYEKLEYGLKEIDLHFVGVSDFIDEQTKSALEKYAELNEQTKENEKTS